MRVGSLVRHKKYHRYIGIVMELDFRDILVAWHDGEVSWTYRRFMEVLCE